MNIIQTIGNLHFISGDLLNSTADYIIHQANCQGVMGAGLAKQLRTVYPAMYQSYRKHCSTYKPSELLGKAFISGRVITVFGQLTYGYDKSVVYTDYNALKTAFRKIHNRLPVNSSIAFPFGFGCGLANGSWAVVRELIHSCFPNRRIYIICKNK